MFTLRKSPFSGSGANVLQFECDNKHRNAIYHWPRQRRRADRSVFVQIGQTAAWVRAGVDHHFVTGDPVFDEHVPVGVAGLAQKLEQALALAGAFFWRFAGEVVLFKGIALQIVEQFDAVFDKGVFPALTDQTPPIGHPQVPAGASHRKLLLETAFLSGLRASELRNLSVNDLDLEENGVHLDASWTKNRKQGFQPLAEELVHRLCAFALADKPAQLYAKFYRGKNAKLKAPDNPLLYVPSHTARDLDIDLKAAGIPKETAEGKLDFHACRLAYINFVLESGVSVKEAQELARHSTPELTFNVYGRTRKERLSETAEKVAANILPAADNAIFMPRQAVGAEQESATPFADRELRLSNNGGGGGNRTRRQLFLTRAVPIQKPNKPVQIKAL